MAMLQIAAQTNIACDERGDHDTEDPYILYCSHCAGYTNEMSLDTFFAQHSPPNSRRVFPFKDATEVMALRIQHSNTDLEATAA
ncbi:MAG: hypothetical protein ACXVCM_24135 [Ktedonobacteraceae bacterium]